MKSIFIWWMFLILPLSVFAQESDISNERLLGLTEKLNALRQEVETLNDEVMSQKQFQEQQLDLLNAQKLETLTAIQNEELEKTRLREKLSTFSQKLKSSESEPLREDLISWLPQIKEYIQSSVPFENKARISSLEEIEKRLENKEASPEKVLSDLWSFLEDELRMSREVGLFRQSIYINSEEKLSWVVRVGTLALYFQTEDGQAGYIQNSNGGWQTHIVSGDEKSQVMDLVDSFKKQVRVGLFQLPNALPLQKGEAL